MALPGSGRMTSDMIRGEFGGGSPMRISGYYRGKGRVPNTSANSRISTAGRIAHSMFYGARKEMSEQEAMSAYVSYINRYSRTGDSPNTPYENGHVGSIVWPFHKHGNPGVFDWTYTFNNTDLPAEDSSCTIALAQSGRRSNQPALQSVQLHNGSYVGFTKVGGFGMPLNSYAGAGISIYILNCDRRDIARIVVRQNTGGGGYSSKAQVTILPTNKWRPVGYKSRLREGTYTEKGEVSIFAGAGTGYKTPSVGSLYSFSSWYNASCAGIVVGDTAKTWDFGPVIRRQDDNWTGLVNLRMIPDGRSPEEFMRASSLSNIYNSDLRALSGEAAMSSGGDRGISVTTYHVRSPQAKESELVDIVSFSTTDSNFSLVVSQSGAVYPRRKSDEGYWEQTFNFFATFTVRSRLFPNKTWTVTNGKFTYTRWYIQTG